MGTIQYDSVIKYRIIAKTDSTMHIGSFLGDADDILADPNTGIPYIQASSLAGMLRDISSQVNGKEITDELFGSARMKENENAYDRRSRICVTDGIMDQKTVKLELRPNVSIDRKTGTVRSENHSGQKFDITYVASDAVFDFFLYLYADKEHLSEWMKKTETILGSVQKGQVRLGAKKSSGSGRIHSENIYKAIYDLTSKEGRDAWKKEYEEEQNPYKEISDQCQAVDQLVKYDIVVEARTEGPIQVKGIALSEFGKDAPDSENIRNSRMEFIIPGTSIRGAIRSQMEKIAAYQGREDLIKQSFGHMGNLHSESMSGNLIFNDVVIGEMAENDQNPIRNRIHIDKFTGGVINQAFFKEKNAAGDLSIHIQIRNTNNPDASLGLLLYALRDLAITTMSLGNGYATGKGFLTISRMIIRSGGGESTICYDKEKKIEDNAKLIDKALAALREVSA